MASDLDLVKGSFNMPESAPEESASPSYLPQTQTMTSFGQEVDVPYGGQSVVDAGTLPRLAARGAGAVYDVGRGGIGLLQGLGNITAGIRTDARQALGLGPEETQNVISQGLEKLGVTEPQSPEQKEESARFPFGKENPLPGREAISEHVIEPFMKKLTGSAEGLKPASEFEEQIGNIVENTVPLLMWRPDLTLAKAGSALLTGTAGQLAKESAKSLDFGKTGQEVARVGTMVGLQMIFPALFGGQKSAEKTGKELMNKEKLIPENSPTNATPIKESMDSALRRSEKKWGLDSETTNWLRDWTDKLKKDITDGNTIRIPRLIGARSEYNQIYDDVPKLLRGKDGVMNKIFDSFSDAVRYAPDAKAKDLFGQVEFGRSLLAAENATSHIKNLIKGNEKLVGATGAASTALGMFLKPAATLASLPGAIAGATAYNAGLGLYKISKYPAYTKWYGQAAQAIASNNIPGAMKPLSNMGKILEKEAPKEITNALKKDAHKSKPKPSSQGDLDLVSGSFNI